MPIFVPDLEALATKLSKQPWLDHGDQGHLVAFKNYGIEFPSVAFRTSRAPGHGGLSAKERRSRNLGWKSVKDTTKAELTVQQMIAGRDAIKKLPKGLSKTRRTELRAQRDEVNAAKRCAGVPSSSEEDDARPISPEVPITGFQACTCLDGETAGPSACAIHPPAVMTRSIQKSAAEEARDLTSVIGAHPSVIGA